MIPFKFTRWQIVAITVVIIVVFILLYMSKKAVDQANKKEFDETVKFFLQEFSEAEANDLAKRFKKYFTWSEFDSPDQPGSGIKNMKPTMMARYVFAREFAQVPFRVNSAYRSVEHNKKVGGVVNSSHTRGYAADTSTRGKDEKVIIKALLKAGFNRIGVYNTFIHADNDPDKPQNVAWKRFTSINQVKNYIA